MTALRLLCLGTVAVAIRSVRLRDPLDSRSSVLIVR